MPNGSKWLTKLIDKTEPVGEQIPTEWAYELEERSAILEYDGGLSREDADKQALIEINNRMKE